jgi:hypothetical protein
MTCTLLEKIYSNKETGEKIINYLNKDDILNLSYCSKSLNSIINQNNYLLLNILNTSRIP